MNHDTVIDTIVSAMLRDAARSIMPLLHDASKEMKEAAEMGGDPAENFDGWLSLNLGQTNRYYMYTLQELTVLRSTVRQVCDTNEVAKNVAKHYRNFIVGKSISIDIVPADFGEDPQMLATTKKDAKVRKMLENWKLFTTVNKFDARCRDWINRAHRDGECIQRIFKQKTCPVLRFIDPMYIRSPGQQAVYGIEYDPKDAEVAKTFFYQPEGESVPKPIPAEQIFFDKRNVDFGAPRGISSYWAILSNLRRLEKVLVNSSVLAAVQAAITMVRKHQTASAAKVKKLVDATSDGIQRTDPTSGRAIVGRRVRPGTILDAPVGTDYLFPSHSVNASSFIDIAEHEIAHVAANFVLPKSWMLAEEPTEPLSPGSPTVANFETEQGIMFEGVHDIFWVVQGMMGINVEQAMKNYDLLFNGKRLAVGKALDEARVDEILQKIGAQGPQTTSAKHGNNYAQERAGTIKHRLTAQPGEAMPGDAGNTAGGSQDGMTTTGGGTKAGDGSGGTQSGAGPKKAKV